MFFFCLSIESPCGWYKFTSIADSNMQLEKLYLAPLYSQCFESKKDQVNEIMKGSAKLTWVSSQESQSDLQVFQN